MLQPLRQLFRRTHAAVIPALAGAWLAFGIATCAVAAPVADHGHDDCPHCETVLVEADCGAQADAVQSSGRAPDVQPAVPATIPVVLASAAREVHVSPPFLVPHERPPRLRYCRLLE